MSFKKTCSQLKLVKSVLSSTNVNQLLIQTSSRSLATHWDPKFRSLRARKVVKPNLPDFDKLRKSPFDINDTPEKRRAHLIKEGISPPVTFEYKPINFSTSGEIFDPYVPPEGDGKASIFTKQFAGKAVEQVSKTLTKKFKHARLVRKHDESFDESSFAQSAQQIYIDAHQALADYDREKLLEFATEHAFSKMWLNMKYKTIRWKWVEPLEEPQVKHIITRELLNKSDLFAQITVRLHSKQILAVYDRFGRLAFGSDKLAKDVLEYVVFERYLTNPYSSWRLHDKIEPEWAPPKSPVLRTFVMPKLYKVDEKLLEKFNSKFKKDDSHLEKLPAESEKPQLNP